VILKTSIFNFFVPNLVSCSLSPEHLYSVELPNIKHPKRLTTILNLLFSKALRIELVLEVLVEAKSFNTITMSSCQASARRIRLSDRLKIAKERSCRPVTRSASSSLVIAEKKEKKSWASSSGIEDDRSFPASQRARISSYSSPSKEPELTTTTATKTTDLPSVKQQDNNDLYKHKSAPEYNVYTQYPASSRRLDYLKSLRNSKSKIIHGSMKKSVSGPFEARNEKNNIVDTRETQGTRTSIRNLEEGGDEPYVSQNVFQRKANQAGRRLKSISFEEDREPEEGPKVEMLPRGSTEAARDDISSIRSSALHKALKSDKRLNDNTVAMILAMENLVRKEIAVENSSSTNTNLRQSLRASEHSILAKLNRIRQSASNHTETTDASSNFEESSHFESKLLKLDGAFGNEKIERQGISSPRKDKAKEIIAKRRPQGVTHEQVSPSNATEAQYSNHSIANSGPSTGQTNNDPYFTAHMHGIHQHTQPDVRHEHVSPRISSEQSQNNNSVSSTRPHEEIENVVTDRVNLHPMPNEYTPASYAEANSTKSGMGNTRQSRDEIENVVTDRVNLHPMPNEYTRASYTEANSTKSCMGIFQQSREEIKNVVIDRRSLHPMAQQERSTSVLRCDQDIKDHEDINVALAEGYSAMNVNVKSMHVDEHNMFQYSTQEAVDTTTNHAMHVAYPIHPVGKSVDPRNAHNTIAFLGGGAGMKPIIQAPIQNQDPPESRTFERSDFGADSRSRFESRSSATLHSSRYQSTSYSLSSGSYSSRSGSYDDDTSDSSY
jgi:hypothetical protein